MESWAGTAGPQIESLNAQPLGEQGWKWLLAKAAKGLRGPDAGDVILTGQARPAKAPATRVRENARQLVHLIIDNLAVAILITHTCRPILKFVAKEFDVVLEAGSNYLPGFFVIVFSIGSMFRLVFMA